MITRAGRWLWYQISTAPLTFGWLAILFVTTVMQHVMSGHAEAHFLQTRSTNVHNLAHDPLRVLWTSLFWLDGAYWLPYLLAFWLLLAPAERWLGKARWLLVGIAGHILATYVSEGLVAFAVHVGRLSHSMLHVRDIGVSYFMAAIFGILVYHQAKPWRWLYLTVIAAYFALPAFVDTSYTTIGHCCALLIGIACYPLTLGRSREQFDLFATARQALTRLRAQRAGVPAPPAGPSC